MLGPVVDPIGSFATRTGMARLGPRPLLAFLGRRLPVGRLHARRRAGRLMRLGRHFGLLLGQSLAQLQNGKHGDLRPLSHDLPRLRFGQRTVAQKIQEIVGRNFRACRHAQ